MVATNDLLLAIREDSVSLELLFLFSRFPWSCPTPSFWSSHSIHSIQRSLVDFLFRKEQSPYFCVPIYLILTLLIRSPRSQLLIPWAASNWATLHGFITTFRALLTKLKHKVPDSGLCQFETRHPGLCFPDFVNQSGNTYVDLIIPTYTYCLESLVPHFMRCFELPERIYQTLAPVTRSTGHMLHWPERPWPEIS